MYIYVFMFLANSFTHLCRHNMHAELGVIFIKQTIQVQYYINSQNQTHYSMGTQKRNFLLNAKIVLHNRNIEQIECKS